MSPCCVLGTGLGTLCALLGHVKGGGESGEMMVIIKKEWSGPETLPMSATIINLRDACVTDRKQCTFNPDQSYWHHGSLHTSALLQQFLVSILGWTSSKALLCGLSSCVHVRVSHLCQKKGKKTLASVWQWFRYINHPIPVLILAKRTGSHLKPTLVLAWHVKVAAPLREPRFQNTPPAANVGEERSWEIWPKRKEINRQLIADEKTEGYHATPPHPESQFNYCQSLQWDFSTESLSQLNMSRIRTHI